MMTEPTKAKSPAINAKDRIIVALDVETADDARKIINDVGSLAGAFKVGLQLFVSAGPDFVRELTSLGVRVFLDLKFHDIPSTVAKASVEAARLGVWMFNMHATGGREMMTAAKDAVKEFCEQTSSNPPIILGVTALTSSNAATLKEAGSEGSVNDHVIRLAKLTAGSGLSGVVASPHEVGLIRDNIKSRDFCIITPGIRPENATKDDQKRVMTPAEAIAAGSDYIVIGRPITAAADRKAALRKIIEDLETSN